MMADPSAVDPSSLDLTGPWGQLGALVFTVIAGVVMAIRKARAQKDQPAIDASAGRVKQMDQTAAPHDLPVDSPNSVQLVQRARDQLGQLLPTWPAATRTSAHTVYVDLGDLLTQGAPIRPDQVQAAAQQLAALAWPDPAEGAHLVQQLLGSVS